MMNVNSAMARMFLDVRALRVSAGRSPRGVHKQGFNSSVIGILADLQANMFARCAPAVIAADCCVRVSPSVPRPPGESASVKHVTTPQVGEEPAHSPLPQD